MPPNVQQALSQVRALGCLVQDIDAAIRLVDEHLDALQPPHTGKIRLSFRKKGDHELPLFVKFILKRNGDWWPKAIKSGMSTRSVKISKEFEANAPYVRLLCREGEELLKLRRTVNRLLGNVTAAGKGSLPGLTKRTRAIQEALGQF